MQRQNGFLSPQNKINKEGYITLQPVKTEENQTKKKEKADGWTSKTLMIQKNTKNKKSIQFKVQELTAMESDFGETLDNIINEKIIIESLDTWSQEKKANGLHSHNNSIKKEETIEDIIKKNNKQIEKNKYITAKQPGDPELSENIINFIMNENVQSAYQDKLDARQQKLQNQWQQQHQQSETKNTFLSTQEHIKEAEIKTITEHDEDQEEEEQEDGEEIEQQQSWFDQINEDELNENQRYSLTSRRSSSIRSQRRSTSKEDKPKKNVKIIKQSIDAQKFEINKNVINTVVYNKMNRGMNIQKKMESDFLLRNRQLDSKTSNTINSFKTVNTTMRKSDFIINYNWLYKKLIENKKQFEKNPELDKEIQAMERDKLNYQYLNSLFIEKYQKMSQDLKQKKLYVGDLRININNMHSEIKQLQMQSIAVKKKYEELENQQTQLKNAMMSSTSRKGLYMGQSYRGNYTIDKKQSVYKKLQEMKELEEMALLKNVRQLQNEIEDMNNKIEDLEKKIVIQKKDKSHLKYQFKVFLFKLIQSGISSQNFKQRFISQFVEFFLNRYKGSICELIKLLWKLKVDIIHQDIPRFLDDESKTFIFKRARIELDLEQVEKEKILIKDEISKDKRLQNIDFNLFLDQFKERKQLMKDKIELIKKENVKVLKPIIKVIEGIQMQNGSQWESVYDEVQMMEKFQERQTIKQVLNIEDIDFLDVLPNILEKQQQLEQQKYELEQLEIQRLYLIFLQKLQQSTADIETKFEKFELTFKVIFGFKEGSDIFKDFIVQVQEKNIVHNTDDSSQSQRLKKANANIIQTLQNSKNSKKQVNSQFLSYFTTPTNGSSSARNLLSPIISDVQSTLSSRKSEVRWLDKQIASLPTSHHDLDNDHIIESITSRTSRSKKPSFSSSIRSTTSGSSFLNQMQIDKARSLLQKGNNSKQQEQILYQEVNFCYEPIFNQMPQFQNMYRSSSFFNSNSSQFQCYTPKSKKTHRRNYSSDINNFEFVK